MNDTTDEGFLGRWSRRKRTGEEIAAVPSDADVADQAAPEPDGQEPDAQEQARQVELAANREAAEAIDIEAITYDSDLSAFFKDGVPALLKQAAMRKMWRSDPVFANVDGLNDYDQDFNVIDKVLTEFKSAWQVGQGYRVPEDLEPEADLEPEPDGDLADTDDAVAKADVRDDGESGAEPADGSTEAETNEIVDEIDEDDAANEPAPVREIDAVTIGRFERPDNIEAEVPEDVRPTVSLRRRMAFFENDREH